MFPRTHRTNRYQFWRFVVTPEIYPIFWAYCMFWKRRCSAGYLQSPLLILSLSVCSTLSEWVLIERVRSLSVMHCSVKDQVVNTMIRDCISGTGRSFTVKLKWHNWLTQHIHPHLDTHTHTHTHTHAHFHSYYTHRASAGALEQAQTGTHTVHGLPLPLFTLPRPLPHCWNSKADGCHFNQN